MRVRAAGTRRRVLRAASALASVRRAAVAVATITVLSLLPGPPAQAAPPRLSVRGAILVAPDTSQTLYAFNAYRELPIASTTKLMTALVVLEHIHHLGTVFTEPNYYPASVDSQIGLVPGERMTVHDLLLALMLPSADDAAEDLAYNVGHTPGRSLASSVGRFVAMMNQQARALGLDRTHYSTPIGLDTPGNYSTASDLVRLAAYDQAHSRYFARIVALPHAVLYSGSHVRYVINRNTLVARYPWVNGVKTGHTAGAGYVLVASGHRQGMTLVSAVLGTSSEAERDANSLALLGYGYGDFRQVTPLGAGQVMARPSVADRPGEHVAVVAATGFGRVIPRSDPVRLRVRVPSQLSGPKPRHAVVGSVAVLLGRRQIARVPLLLARALAAVSPITLAARFITRPLTLVIMLMLVLALAALAFRGRQRKRLRGGRGGLETA